MTLVRTAAAALHVLFFWWRPTRCTAFVTASARRGGTIVVSRERLSKVIPADAPAAGTLLIMSSASGSAVRSSEAIKQFEARSDGGKVVKPWLTKAQETVDYSNVEAM